MGRSNVSDVKSCLNKPIGRRSCISLLMSRQILASDEDSKRVEQQGQCLYVLDFYFIFSSFNSACRITLGVPPDTHVTMVLCQDARSREKVSDAEARLLSELRQKHFSSQRRHAHRSISTIRHSSPPISNPLSDSYCPTMQECHRTCL
jgi:hypothetical protein